MDSGESNKNEETITVPVFFVKFQRRMIVSIGVIMLSMLALTLASTLYAVRINNASQQAICPVFVSLDQVYHQSPPTTVAGKKFATVVHSVVVKYHCSGKNLP
jgi:hypothetical protein